MSVRSSALSVRGTDLDMLEDGDRDLRMRDDRDMHIGQQCFRTLQPLDASSDREDVRVGIIVGIFHIARLVSHIHVQRVSFPFSRHT